MPTLLTNDNFSQSYPLSFLFSGSLQVRLLRGVQEHLLGHPGRGEHLPVQDLAVPRSLRLGRVLCRHRPQPHGVGQGESVVSLQEDFCANKI